MQSEPSHRRAPAESLSIRPSVEPQKPISARQFLAHANQLVDEIEADRIATRVPPLDLVEFLKGEHPRPRPQLVACETLPARFRREPDIFLGNVRFGRRGLRWFRSRHAITVVKLVERYAEHGLVGYIGLLRRGVGL